MKDPYYYDEKHGILTIVDIMLYADGHVMAPTSIRVEDTDGLLSKRRMSSSLLDEIQSPSLLDEFMNAMRRGDI